jgi:hypoxanthine phosphoribosyltransferase
MKSEQIREQLTEILFTRTQIEDRAKELAEQISNDYQGKEVMLIGALRGAVPFVDVLMMNLSINVECDWFSLMSYEGAKSTGEIKVEKEITLDPTGKHIIIIDDILDTGATILWLKDYFSKLDVASVKVAVMLDKTQAHGDEVKADYVAFDCPLKFLIGYGLDYNQKYRNLEDIAVLSPSVYS